ncbi:MAG: hypothetical protein ABW199_11220 [Caulobacterales bacterium]
MKIPEAARRYAEKASAFARSVRARFFPERGDLAKPSLQSRLRARLHRYARMVGGFALSVVFLGAIAIFAMEWFARVSFNQEVTSVAPEGASKGIAAAEYMLSLSARDMDDIASDRIFAPSSLRRRETDAFQAAGDVAFDYIAMLRVQRGARDERIADLRKAEEESDARAAMNALERVNHGMVRGQITLDLSPAAFRALAAEAAGSCAARAAETSERARLFGREGREDDAAFHAARGEAYAWGAILRAAARDSGSADMENNPALFRALEALDHAAAYRPVLFLSGVRGGVIAANHLAFVGLDLAVAAQELRSLAAGGG